MTSCNNYDFETETSATAFNGDFTAYLTYQEYVSEWSKSFVSDALLESWFNQIRNIFSDKNKSAGQNVDVFDSTVTIADSDEKSASENISGLSVPEYYAYCFSSDMTLQKDLVIDGNTIMSASVDLNGYTLTINGNLIQNGGTMQIYGGILNINGDYTIQNKNHVDSKTGKTIEDSNGRLLMMYAGRAVNVHGDFYMKSNTNGTLAIDGNFYQYNKVTNIHSIKAAVAAAFDYITNGDKTIMLAEPSDSKAQGETRSSHTT